ncbi:ArnT family glycosyltransferase [Paenibacillus sp. GCM10012307]|uniref:Glycosyltransferase family 39 protein n=1 Tax=Paenibacillus roseus TaxID=2798579 RepID=A0A934J6M6_9BACL|nr:glycosyltransferase family 39 protein [Paenibacillus roseus]MBJ6361357.1 glycosyltransferase family 39 protein [Paenibacillus roseus]
MTKRTILPWIIFLFILAVEFALGFYFSYVKGYMHNDALSRVANAFYVLYSRDPHLGAIGFVWNPLPSLMMETVLLVFYPLFPVLASRGLAAVIMSATFAALTAVLIYKTGIRYQLSKSMSAGLALLFSLNPFILLFGANGLSDAPYIYFLMFTIIEFTIWIRERKTSSLILAGFALSLAFWTRYEAVPFGVSLALGIVIVILMLHHRDAADPKLKLLEKYNKIEATWILVLIPSIFSGFLWMFFNYTIMGNAFYFLNSEYSNVAQSEQLQNDANFVKLFNSPLLALWFIAKKTMWYSMPFVGLLLIRLFTKRLLKPDFLILLLLFAAVPGMQFALLMNASSFGWFRYFLYVFPVVVAWLPYELSLITEKWKRRAAFSLLAVCMVITGGLLAYAVNDPEIAPDEHNFLQLDTNEYVVAQREERIVAQWLDEHITKDTIMTDSSNAFTILLNTHNLKRFLITSDYAFKKAMEDPFGNNVDYILVPNPSRNGPKSSINMKYPELYDKGMSWATLHHDFDNKWRLYKVHERIEIEAEKTVSR